ncbi:MAG: PolC-type DNA polymerase III [Epulopiscium sp.]|nr:PolC-type DNA polymerase III [Candidatus Epulonipiscium sp.]
MSGSNTLCQFCEVFDFVPLEDSIQSIFARVQVRKIIVSPNKKKIYVYLVAQNLIDISMIEVLQKQLEDYIGPKIKISVKIQYEFKKESLSPTWMNQYWEQIISMIKYDSPLCMGILQDSSWQVQDHFLTIATKNNSSFYLHRKKIDNQIESLIREQLGLNMKVVFQDEEMSTEEKKQYEEQMEKQENLLIQEVVQEVPSSIISTSSNSTESSFLLGKAFSGPTISMRELQPESGTIIIEGRVIGVEAREIKGGRYILAFDMTDEQDAVTVKCFLKKEKYELEIAPKIKKNIFLRVKGEVQYDRFSQESVVMAKNIELIEGTIVTREDGSKEKRVELHAHTQMSTMDGVVSVTALIERAAKWGHSAIAITDHGVVQAFPEAALAAKKLGIKVIYGVEAYLVDDLKTVVQNSKNQKLEDTYIVFDIETTGFYPGKDRITEIGAMKIQNGEIIDSFSTFVNPGIPIPLNIQELTGITDDTVKDAPPISVVLPQFLEFVGDGVLVAHNASFDVNFIRYFAKQQSLQISSTVLDTLALTRGLFPQLKRHKLNIVAEHLGISLENHHRAVDDAQATAEIFLKCIQILKDKKLDTLDQVNQLVEQSLDIKKLRSHHAIILVKNQKGLKNLYRLISMSHIDYFYRQPRIPKSAYLAHKEGLIIGTACEAGELYRAVLENKPEEVIQELMQFYDYVEIQPIGNNQFLIHNNTVNSQEDLKDINRKILAIGEKYQKPVVATGDVHFLDPEDEIYRKILMMGQGFSDAEKQPPLYLRTTEEMLKEFSYLGTDKAKEVVITYPNQIADQIERIKPIPDGTFPPSIEGAEEELIRITTEKAKSMYGEPLPEPVQKRLDRELGSIIKNGFAVLYIIAQKLVWKSLEDGYLVGSRGSVGSSFVATMAGITEVNPLSPHYYCPTCQYSDFDSETVKSFVGGSGCDMPDKYCPKCNTLLCKDGHDIPFETFLGFDGDKEPDIDLNFSGEYQPRAHAYTEELFGKGHVFRAGTIGTLAEKTAYGFVRKYLDEKGIVARNAQVNRLIQGCTGVKRTTGQHPGGQMIVPNGYEIYEFCPIQRPANDVNSTITTTHFDYHSISGRLLKLDILGHDDPTVIRMLEDMTGINAREIPLDDKKTMSLFTSTEALGIEPEVIKSSVGSLGLPEFGTKFVRQMLVDTKPKTFSELIRISGLSHGTDVWLNNAQDLVRNGTATLSEVISTRDDIMVYLILQGVEKKQAFKIMEKVRKGKGLEPEDEEAMREARVPDWYIDSCKKIKYMFPKAHAAAYVMMAFRIAYFKVYYPECFYATFFTVRADDFDYELMCKGMEKVQTTIQDLEEKGNQLTTKEKNVLTILEIVLEMYARGISFLPIDLYQSHAVQFQVKEEGILPPLNALQGLGNTAAMNILQARAEGEFLSVEEFRQRTKVSKTVIELMKENGIFKGIPETSQLSLF